MLTWEEDVEAHALRARGWSISAIAGHLGRDRKTIRAYLSGARVPGARRPAGPDALEPFVAYLERRFGEDPHVWASALFDEVVALGFDRSYPSFTRLLRARGLRPHCEACSGVRGRATTEIDHPPGEEIQWDWVELPGAPWGGEAHLLVATLPYSGRFRGVFAEAEDQAHLIEAIDGVLRRLGGTARRWRVDRLATVIVPGTARVQASFAPVAKHYGVGVDPCPPRRGNRKGSVEKSIHYLTQRWWRTAAVTTMAEAQGSFDRFCATTADDRLRPRARLGAEAVAAGQPRPTVRELAEAEVLRPLPAAPYPAVMQSASKVGPSALAAFAGNAYSVPVGLVGAVVACRHRLGASTLEIVSPAGAVVAVHRLEPAGAGVVARLPEHAAALENVVLGAFTTERPCARKANRPPGPAARAEAERLLAGLGGGEVVVDLAAYQAIVEGRA
jgi:transposase